MFVLEWYSGEGDGFSGCGLEELPTVTKRNIVEWFGIPIREVGYGHIVRASQKVHLDKITKHKIDLNLNDYFIEQYIDD